MKFNLFKKKENPSITENEITISELENGYVFSVEYGEDDNSRSKEWYVSTKAELLQKIEEYLFV